MNKVSPLIDKGAKNPKRANPQITPIAQVIDSIRVINLCDLRNLWIIDFLPCHLIKGEI